MTIAEMIQQEAAARGVPPSIALAVAQRESGFNQYALGKKGEVGVFQLMPTTAESLHVDPYNLQQNVSGGISYLRQMYDQFGSWYLALAAYNAGPGRVSSGSIPASSAAYASSILASTGISDQGIQQAETPFRFETWVDEFLGTGSSAGGFPGGEPFGEGINPWLLVAAAALAVVVVAR